MTVCTISPMRLPPNATLPTVGVGEKHQAPRRNGPKGQEHVSPRPNSLGPLLFLLFIKHSFAKFLAMDSGSRFTSGEGT